MDQRIKKEKKVVAKEISENIVFIRISILLQSGVFWRTSNFYPVIGSDIDKLIIFIMA